MKREIIFKELMQKFYSLEQEGYYILNDFEHFKEYTRQSFIFKDSIPKSRLLTRKDYIQTTEDKLFYQKLKKKFSKLKFSETKHGNYSFGAKFLSHKQLVSEDTDSENEEKGDQLGAKLNASDIIPPLQPHIQRIYNSVIPFLEK